MSTTRTGPPIAPVLHRSLLTSLLLVTGVMIVVRSGDDASPRAKTFAAISLTLLVSIMCAGRMLTFYRP